MNLKQCYFDWTNTVQRVQLHHLSVIECYLSDLSAPTQFFNFILRHWVMRKKMSQPKQFAWALVYLLLLRDI